MDRTLLSFFAFHSRISGNMSLVFPFIVFSFFFGFPLHMEGQNLLYTLSLHSCFENFCFLSRLSCVMVNTLLMD